LGIAAKAAILIVIKPRAKARGNSKFLLGLRSFYSSN